jgi:uncharacterized membrane protein
MYLFELISLGLLLAILVRASKIAGRLALIDTRIAAFERLLDASLAQAGPAPASAGVDGVASAVVAGPWARAAETWNEGAPTEREPLPADSVPQPAAPIAEPAPAETEIEPRTEPALPWAARVADDIGNDAPEPMVSAAAGEEPAATEPPQAAEAPPERPDFELNFGRRWAVLIGGGAVALGSILLVRHSIMQGYFPPAARLAAAALFSLLLVAAAEFLRRKGLFASLRALPKAMPDIPSTLFGAGAAGLFATIFAAHAVYGFIAAGPAFLLMGAVALSGVAASLSYGPPLAVLGYLAAQAVPLLVGGHAGMTTALYIGGVGLASYAVAYRRSWAWLEMIVAGVLGAWVLFLRLGTPIDAGVVAAAAGIGAVLVSVLRLDPRPALATDRPPGMAQTVCLALAVLGGAAVAMPEPIIYRPLPTITGLVVLVAALASSVLVPSARRVAPLAALALLGVLAGLLGSAPNAEGDARFGAPVIGLTLGHIEHLFGWISAAVLALALLAVRRMTRISPATALFGIVSLALLLIGGDLVLRDFKGVDRMLLAGFAGLQGAVLLAAGWPKAGQLPPDRELASVLAAAGGLGLLGLVPAFLLTGPSLTLALALVVLAAAALAVSWRAPALVSVAATLCLVLLGHSGLEAARTFLRFRHTAGTDLAPLLVNTALPGVLVALAILLLRSRMAKAEFAAGEALWRSWLRAPASGQSLPPLSLVAMMASAGALLLSGLVLAVRWLVFGDAYAPLEAPTDLGVFAAFALSGALTMLRLERATGSASAGRACAALAGLGVFGLGLALVANPFTATAEIGRLPLLNLLALAYLVPAAIAFALAIGLRRMPRTVASARPELLIQLAGAAAIAGSFAFVTFSVTQAFQGRALHFAAITESELWAYTLVWLVYGIALLLFGLRTQSRSARLAAFGVMIVVSLKAFLVDMSHLTGVARALSFIALGLVLLGIGMFYQRMMARQAPQAA